MSDSPAGKGDRPRPVDRKKWDEAWARIEKMKLERNKDGNTKRRHKDM
jgi:hypothetical protein